MEKTGTCWCSLFFMSDGCFWRDDLRELPSHTTERAFRFYKTESSIGSCRNAVPNEDWPDHK